MDSEIPVIWSACVTAVDSGASDLFLHEGTAPRMRLHGKMQTLPNQPVPRSELECLWRRLDNENSREKEIDAHLDLAPGRFRVNIYHHLGQLGATLRVVKRQVPDFDELLIPGVMKEWVARPSGLVLVCGPTGSGKSTTAAASLDWLNQRAAKHVVTIEDPVEFLFQSRRSMFTQKEVPGDTASFAEGLRSALRQSPDIVFVGEIRDFDTAEIALQAAETGHLVISTLHSATTTECIDRLAHLMPLDLRSGYLSLLGEQLIGVVAQKLLPATDGDRRLVTEILENEGVIRKWMGEGDSARVRDYLDREAVSPNQSFVAALFRDFQEEKISESTARTAAPRPADFHRLCQGIVVR